jgi:hypothetical protein
MSMGTITPSSFFIKIEYVYYKTNELSGRGVPMRELEGALEAENEKVRQAEYRTLQKIKPMPLYLLQEGGKKTAGYREVSSSKKDRK